MLNKYTTLFQQSEKIDTDEIFAERDKIYKEMTFEEIINIVNEVKEISELIATNLHEFNLDAIEIGAIGREIKSMGDIGDCLTTIGLLKSIKGEK